MDASKTKPVEENIAPLEHPLILQLIRDAQIYGIAEFRYKSLHIRFSRPENNRQQKGAWASSTVKLK